MKILFLAKEREISNKAYSYLKDAFMAYCEETVRIDCFMGNEKPRISKEYNITISFLCPWILSQNLLDQSEININFHPAPPEYPGIGGYNFAIYNEDKRYGVTCHHMTSKVDSGPIIKVRYFEMKNETVMSLQEKSMVELFYLYKEIIDKLAQGYELPITARKWKKDAYTRKDLQKLCKLDFSMKKQEIEKRIKATYYPGAIDLPYFDIDTFRFRLEDKK